MHGQKRAVGRVLQAEQHLGAKFGVVVLDFGQMRLGHGVVVVRVLVLVDQSRQIAQTDEGDCAHQYDHGGQ